MSEVDTPRNMVLVEDVAAAMEDNWHTLRWGAGEWAVTEDYIRRVVSDHHKTCLDALLDMVKRHRAATDSANRSLP